MNRTSNTKPSNILATLQAAANLLLSAVAPTTSRLVRVEVRISDETETAATDGSIYIRMPTRFCDVLVSDNVQVAVGLLVHEVGHFLQPLDEIDQVEKDEAIPHWLTNVVLDIQGESLLEIISPTFRKPLAAVRRVVNRCRLAEYVVGIGRASDFAEAAGGLALWGRFAEPSLPFFAQHVPPTVQDMRTAHRFVNALDGFRHCQARRLPECLAALSRLPGPGPH